MKGEEAITKACAEATPSPTDMSFMPDWRMVVRDKEDFARRCFTAEEMEWKGPGIYISKGDYMLIVPVESSPHEVHGVYETDPWRQNAPGPFWVYCWNGHDPFAVMVSIIRAPTRTDDR